KVLCLENKGGNIFLKLNPISKWNSFSFGDYIVERPNEKDLFNKKANRIPFNYRLNCVLHYKYNIDLSETSRYSGLYKLRSNSVAHMGKSKVQAKDILTSIELLNILID